MSYITEQFIYRSCNELSNLGSNKAGYGATHVGEPHQDPSVASPNVKVVDTVTAIN